MNKNIKLNYIYNAMYQILLILIPFITLPYLTRTLGAVGIGTFSFAESIVSYFTLFASLGINIYGQREISYNQKNRKKRSIVFYNTLLLKIIIALIVTFFYIIFYIYKLNSPIYLVLIINLITVIFDISWFFQGIEEFGRIVAINTIFRIIQVISIFCFVKKSSDIVIYTFIYAAAPFLSNFCLFINLNKYIDDVDFKKLTPFKNIYVAFTLFIPTIAIQVYTVLDKTMIGIITGDAAENGYYELAIKSSKMILTLVTALGTVVLPRVGYYFEQKNKEAIKKLMYKSYEFVWFLGLPLAFGFFMISDNFVPWYFGNGYDKATLLIKILCFLIPIIGISNVTGLQYLVPTKRQGFLTLTVCVGATTNFILNLFLIHIYKSVGAAVGSIVAELLITIFQLFLVRKELNVFTIIKSSFNYLISSFIMIFVLLLMSKLFYPSLINTIILIISGTLAYFLALFTIAKRLPVNISAFKCSKKF